MKNRKLVGILLLIASLFMIAGIIVNNSILWTIVDGIVILICCGSAMYLLIQKDK
ncbi:MAG: hypothetical protein JXA06_05130 [Bacteroidetes bacterium]|nr:hypothetical protein [Bacteroidota bacterium]